MSPVLLWVFAHLVKHSELIPSTFHDFTAISWIQGKTEGMTLQTAGPRKFMEIPGYYLTLLYSLFQTPLPELPPSSLLYSVSLVFHRVWFFVAQSSYSCNRYEINSSQCFFCNLRGFQACPPLSSTHLTLCPEERLVHLGLSQQRYRSAKLAHLPFLVNLWEKGIAAQLQSSCEMGHSVGFNCLTGSALLGFFLKGTVVT